MKRLMIFLFLWAVTTRMFGVTIGDDDPYYSYLVTCSEDMFGYVTISWEGPIDPFLIQYTVVISGGLIETHYTTSNSITTKSPLPRGQMISIVVGRLDRREESIVPGGPGNYVEHARGSYIHGSSASGPCPKKIGAATVTFYREIIDNGRWNWFMRVDHDKDPDTNNAHTAFRVFVFAESMEGYVAGFDYCSGGGSVMISGDDGKRRFYVKVVAVDCIGESQSSEGHYLYGEVDLLNLRSGTVGLSEVNI